MRPSLPALSVVDVVEGAAIPAALAVATFLAATPWLRTFAIPGTAALLVMAAVASVSIPALAIRVWRQPPAVSYAASVLGLLVLLFAAAGLHPDALWHGFTRGPNQLLTETLPLGGGRALLAGPLLLTWLAGTASTELVTRSRRSGSGLAAVGLAIPMGCFVIGYSVAASRPGRDEVAAPVLLVTLVLIAIARHLLGLATTPQADMGRSIDADARPSTWRPGLAGGAIAVVIAVGLAVVVPTLPVMSRRPASLNRAPPLTTAVIIDPLDALATLRDGNPRGPARTVLDVVTDQPSNGYLGLAVLDDYDGAVWSFNTTFQPTGGRIPGGPGGVTAGVVGLTTVRQRTTVDEALPVSLLPALDRAVEVTGVPVAADAATGMLVPSHPVTTGASYGVVSRAPDATFGTVPAADGIGAAAGSVSSGAPGLSAADLALPANTSTDMATAMRTLSTLTGRRPAPTVAFLQALLTTLHADERRIDPALTPPTPTGTSTPTRKKSKATRPSPTTVVPTPAPSQPGSTSLSEAINAVTNLRVGTPEQFATLFALAARYLGVPARVVSGFRLGASSAAGLVAAGAHQVTNRQAWAWVEIPVAGLGWVVADPTPDAVTGLLKAPPEGVQTSASTVPPAQANAVPRADSTGGHALAKPAPIKVPKSHPVPWWVEALIAVVGAVVLAALLGPGLAGARRLRRRRARRRADPSELAVGAWLELLDGLQQAGMAAGAAATTAEVASEAGRHFGPDVTGPVQEVGAVADRAVCSVAAPPDAGAAEAAWAAQRAVRQTIRQGLDRRQRARALLAVGSAPREPSAEPAPARARRLRIRSR